MNKILLNLLLILSSQFSLAQEIDKEIIDFFSDEKNQNYVNNNGYYFIDIPLEKSYQNRLSGTINIKDTSYIDFKMIDVNFDINDYRYYLLANKKVILVLKSLNHIIKEMDLND